MIEMQRNVCNGHGMTIMRGTNSAPCRKRFELRHNSLALTPHIGRHRRGMQASLSKTESITGVANGDPAVHLARGGSFGSPPRYRRAENRLLWVRALDHGSESIDQLREARAAEAGITDADRWMSLSLCEDTPRD